MAGEAVVVAVSRAATHGFSKQPCDAIALIEGLGVAGDAHAGETVRHRSRVAKDPSQPNLRQVHLIHAELLDELAAQGLAVKVGDLGENVLTRGIDLLGLSRGTRLLIGQAELEITGLRNPCAQIERFMPGLLSAVLDRDSAGALVRKCGVMAIVLRGGRVCPGDPVSAAAPAFAQEPLLPV